MAIFRCIHNQNFTVINNDILDDFSLSDCAHRILTHVLRLPDSWEFNEQYFINKFPSGRDKIRSALKELESRGYLIRERQRVEGKLAKNSWIFLEVPGCQPIINQTEYRETDAGNLLPESKFLETSSLLLGTSQTTLSNTYIANKEIANTNINNSILSDDAVDAVAIEDKKLKKILNVISQESIPLSSIFITGMYNLYGSQLVAETIDEMYPEGRDLDSRSSIQNPPGLFTFLIKSKNEYNTTCKTRAGAGGGAGVREPMVVGGAR